MFSVRVRVISWSGGSEAVFKDLCLGIVRSLSALEGISSSAMKSSLIVVCALIVPLIGGSLSCDRLP